MSTFLPSQGNLADTLGYRRKEGDRPIRALGPGHGGLPGLSFMHCTQPQESGTQPRAPQGALSVLVGAAPAP